MIILFDGACNLCNRSVQFILERDENKRFKFASMQCDLGRRLMKAHGLDPQDTRSVVLIEGGRIYTRSDAAIRIAVELSGMWPMLGLLHFLPRPLRNWGYNIVAENRFKWFGSSSSCMVPSSEDLDRFLC